MPEFLPGSPSWYRAVYQTGAEPPCDLCAAGHSMPYGTCHGCGRKWGSCAEAAEKAAKLAFPGPVNPEQTDAEKVAEAKGCCCLASTFTGLPLLGTGAGYLLGGFGGLLAGLGLSIVLGALLVLGLLATQKGKGG